MTPAPVALAALLAAGPAPAAGTPDPTPTFRYEAPAAPHRLRAAAEIGGVVALGAAAWLVAPSRTTTTGSKGDGVRLDANPFRTNFVAHPVAGAVYYQLARSNRLSAVESALWSVAGSTVWEVVEYTEPASLNDLVVTPVAGVALGAPLFELAAHLDRGPRTAAGEVLAWLVALPKKAHDAVDGARPARGEPGDALEASSGASAGAARGADGAWRGELRAHAGFRLVRDPAWGAAGEGTRVLRDAAVTALGVEAALSTRGLADLSFASGVLLVALHRRDLSDAGDGVRGVEGLAGTGAGFVFLAHDWGLGALDRLSVVELPALLAEGRWFGRGLRVSGRISAAPTFGGVHSLALAADPAAVPPDDVPTVQASWDYHFAAGAALAPAVEVRAGPLALEASGRADWLWGVNQPDANPGRRPAGDFFDRWLAGAVRARVAVARRLELSAALAHKERRSAADAAGASTRETSFTMGAAWAP